MPDIKPTLATQPVCDAFVSAARLLQAGRAGEIDESELADFVALEWMAWHQGTLRMTALGRMALARLRPRNLEAA